MGSINFDPAKDIPNLSGKVILVTGGTAGIGSETVLQLAKHNPEHLYFSGRSEKQAAAVISDVKAAVPSANITFVQCDLASLASVSSAVQNFPSKRLDVLICNAGVMALPPGLTKDGYEVQFGINHLGHALLIKLLLPTILQTAEDHDSDVRIIILTSVGFRGHPSGGITFKDLRTTQDTGVAAPWIRYGQSKLANILYAAELARRYPRITSLSVHPGVVKTGLVENLSLANRALIHITNIGRIKTVQEAALNQLWAATGDKAKIANGGFYEPVGVPSKKHDKQSKSEELAKQLWEWTEKELAAYN